MLIFRTRKWIRKLLKKGYSKEKIYAEYRSEIDEKILRKALSSLPAECDRKRYRFVHKFLIFFLSLEVLFSILELIGSNFSYYYDIVMYTIILISVIRYYSWIFLNATFWIIIKEFTLSFSQIRDVIMGNLPYDSRIFYILILTDLIIIFLLLIIKVKVFPYTTLLVFQTDSNGDIIFQKNN